MEENTDYTVPTSTEEEFELNHTDKLVGVFTEPSETFESISRFPAKATDWFLPLLILTIVAVLSNFIMMSNPTIKYQIVEKQVAETEKALTKMVDEGTISEEQADKQIEQTRNFMENNMGATMIIQIVATVIFIFLFFFIIGSVFHLIAKFGLKGEGDYSASLVAYGLPTYISIVQVILMVLAAMLMDKMLTDLSVASFLDMNKQEIGGYLLSKVDIFSFWFYGIFGLALAKIHKAQSAGKYIITVYAVWLVFSIAFFYFAQAVPFFQSFIR